MPYRRALRLVLLTLCGILVPAVLAAEYPQGPVPTLWNEPPELPSGAGPFDAATTAGSLGGGRGVMPAALPGVAGLTPALSSAPAGSLGPGAIGAIVIASLLGTSVLVALVVITLRKFSAS
nr:PREDICTED: uncharacterized protein C2orf82 homolog [Apteryx mantelli mantelli]